MKTLIEYIRGNETIRPYSLLSSWSLTYSTVNIAIRILVLERE